MSLFVILVVGSALLLLNPLLGVLFLIGALMASA